jgi:DNA recombination protein RmuC
MEQSVLLVALIAVSALAIILLILLIAKGRLTGAAILSDIDRKLDQIERIGDDFSTISNLFLVPYSRGGMGETLLNELLASWLPAKAYSLQYSFQDGSRADAIIRLGNYIIPVDAKFPLERVRSVLDGSQGPGALPADIKRTFLQYAEEIGKKYIHPNEGTLDFALMYIPSEKVYYSTFLLDPGDLLAGCLEKGVLPVSPAGLFLYLQTVSFGFKGFALPEKQKELVRNVAQLRKDLAAFTRYFDIMGTHLKNLSASYDDSRSRLGRVDRDVSRIEES